MPGKPSIPNPFLPWKEGAHLESLTLQGEGEGKQSRLVASRPIVDFAIYLNLNIDSSMPLFNCTSTYEMTAATLPSMFLTVSFVAIQAPFS